MLYAAMSRQNGLQCRIGYTLEQDPAENSTVIHLKTVEMNAQTAMGSYWITGSLSIGGRKVWGYDNWYSQIYLSTGWNRAGHCPERAPAVQVEHQPDGSGSVHFSVRFTFGSAGSSHDYSASVTVELPAIPRNSTVEVRNVTLGQLAEVQIHRALDTLPVSILWRCGTESGILAEKTLEDSINWIPEFRLAAQEPEKDTVDVILTVTTWSGDTEFGSSEQTVTCRIPDRLRPIVDFEVTDLTDLRQRFGDFVELRSLVQVLTDAMGLYGARITRIDVTCGHLSGTGEDVRFRISGSGQIPVTVTVTDSRGMITQESCTIRVIPCSRPVIRILQLRRCTADGTAQPDGDHAAVTFTASVSPVENQNSVQILLQRRSSSGTWHETAVSQYSGCYEIEEGQIVFPAGTNESYLVCLLVRDDFEAVSCMEERLGAAFAMLDFDRDSLAIGIGQRAGIANTVSLGLDMNMNTHRLTGLPEPEAGTDAASKQYVDDLLAALARQLNIQWEGV